MKKFTNRHGCLWIIPLLFLGIFYFYPLFNIIGISFTRADTGVVNVFIDALSTPTVRKVLWFSLWQALLSTLLTLLVGLPGAYLLARFKFRGKALLRALSSVPFVMPTLVVASAFNALLGPRGWINLGLMDTFNLAGPPIKFVNTLTAILVAHIFYNTTIVLRMVGDFWSHLDSRLTQASQVLGANRWQTWWLVTFPIISPVIAAAALLVFVFNFSSFGVILVLGGPQFSTLEVEIYYQTISLFNLPIAAVLSVIQLATTMTLLLIYTRLSRRLSQPLSLRASQANQLPLNTWARRIFASLVIGFMIVFFISPLAGLAARSFTRLEPDLGQRTFSKGLTVDFYRALSVNENNSSFYAPPTTAVAISLQFALVTVVFSLLIGLPAAWALTHQKDSKFTRLLDLIFMLP
ncbi:MAG: ABC transporter permease subunit, partial [Chloroflexota bacterium]